MMEKNGSLKLSPEEVKQIREGVVPDRIKDSWGLSLEELSVMIAAGDYQSTELNHNKVP